MTVNYLKMEILSFQSCTNPLRLSSLKGWVRGLAFSADGFLIPTPQICYIYTVVVSKLILNAVVFYTLWLCNIHRFSENKSEKRKKKRILTLS